MAFGFYRMVSECLGTFVFFLNHVFPICLILEPSSPNLKMMNRIANHFAYRHTFLSDKLYPF